jgi:hypothetical protein
MVNTVNEDTKKNKESKIPKRDGDLKKFMLFAGKSLLWNTIWLLPCSCLIIRLCVCDSVERPIGLVSCFLFIGILVSLCIWSFASRLRDDIDMERERENDDESALNWQLLKFWKNDNDTPYWKTLHWFAVIGFLSLTFVIMALGMSSLFIEDKTGTQIFVWVFSFFITFTLFWLIIMISRRGRMWQWFLVFYIVFDLLSAFTFNYFHFYDNVSKTQRMENSIRYSRQLVEMVGTPISEEKTRIDSISNSETVQSLLQEKERKKNELGSIPNKREKTKTIRCEYSDSNGNSRVETTDVLVKSKEDFDKDEEILKRQLKTVDSLLIIYYKGTSGSSMSAILHNEDSLCKEIQRKIRNFEKETKREKKLTTRDSIVNEINALSGMLEITLPEGLKDSSINDMVKIIKDSEVTRLESVERLFTALGRIFSDKDELEKSKDRLVYMSVALSILIDLLPMLLGLFVALSTAPPNYTKKLFLKDKEYDNYTNNTNDNEDE